MQACEMKHIYINAHKYDYALDKSRVARLSEFPSIGRLCTMGSFFKITEAQQIFGLYLSAKNVMY
jgi:hypothetical protein